MTDLGNLLDELADKVARRIIELESERVRYMTPREMAVRMKVAEKTLSNLRWRGGGPKYVKVGGKVRYPVDLDDNP